MYTQLTAIIFDYWGGYVLIWGRIVHILLKAQNVQEWQN